MDPISISIVTALSAGAVAAAKDVATSAIKDAYSALKKVITEKFHKSAPFVDALEADPTSEPEQQVLAKQLQGAGKDNDIKELVTSLLKALETLETDPGAQAMFDFKKLRAARNFELSDIEFSGPLMVVHEDANFEGDFKATKLRQKPSGVSSGN